MESIWQDPEYEKQKLPMRQSASSLLNDIVKQNHQDFNMSKEEKNHRNDKTIGRKEDEKDESRDWWANSRSSI